MANDITSKGQKSGWKDLALAIVEKAVADWRYLCDGGEEVGNLNFHELEHFFKTDCATYAMFLDTTADEIWQKMKDERMLAGL